MVPLILGSAAAGLGTTILGGVLGAREAERQQAEQARREKYNQMMSALDTRYQAFGMSANGPRLAEKPATLTSEGAWGNAVIGGLQQGMNVYGNMSAAQGLQAGNAANNATTADALKTQATDPYMAYQGRNADPYTNYYMQMKK